MAEQLPEAPEFWTLCYREPLYVSYATPEPTKVDNVHAGMYGTKTYEIGYPQKLSAWQGQVDGYCVECEREVPFVGDANEHPGNPFYKTFTCRRAEHTIGFHFTWTRQTITKIGQLPSLADFAEGDLSRYRAALGKEWFPELRRAIGLAAHGVGIGSFVYVRRILERLIEQAHERALKAPGWDDTGYAAKHVEERIATLKGFLPDTMVGAYQVYAILSKGIHELAERECLEHFDVMRESISAILDAEIERQEREKKEAGIAAKVAALTGKLRGKP